MTVSAPRSGPKAKVAVVGLGLVGGSLARALTAAGYRVLGVDRPAVCRAARAAGAVAETVSAVERAAASDVLVLAAPPVANRELLRRLARVARPGAVITDVGSVKGPIVREASRLRLASFVGGHPMAGTERRGFAATSAGLFEGAVWWLVPAADPRATRTVRSLVRAVGARPSTIDAARHDRIVAFLSHAPQLASARSPEGLWREILQENRAEVARALVAVARRLAARAPDAAGSQKRRKPRRRSGKRG
jgi:prephenate dehydrogenase